jgi:transposase
MRPRGSPEKLEGRRTLAMEILSDGHSASKVAKLLGCRRYSVERWRTAFERRGTVGLKAKPAPGRPPRLTARDTRRLLTVLLKGALARGYRTELWTTQRIAEVIEAEFGVRFHRDHVGRLMHRLDWTPQKPDRRALERDEEEIERWKREEWPRIKKGLHGWGPTSCFSTNRASR